MCPFGVSHDAVAVNSTNRWRFVGQRGAGCGTQPGVGVPMVVISGKLAAARITG